MGNPAFYGGNKTASTETLYAWSKANGSFHKTGERGDIPLMHFGTPGRNVEHAGIVERMLSTGPQTIEGNTSAGNQSNGGEVMRRSRGHSNVVGYYRPAYASEAEKNRVIAVAASQIGVKESPKGSNIQPYGAAFGWNGVAWCVIYLWWCFAQVEHAAEPANAVYRFYNKLNGAHFYTASAAERDTVIARWGSVYGYEGVAWTLSGGTVPLHRFYSPRTGAHFYTASEDEKNRVIAKWPGVYRYEGVAWMARDSGVPVYRFYNVRSGAHFYTASAAERDNVIAKWPGIYAYENIGFYA